MWPARAAISRIDPKQAAFKAHYILLENQYVR
jgi:hypothetical protein